MQNDNQPIGQLVKQLDQLLTTGINATQASSGLTRTGWQLLHTIYQQLGIATEMLQEQLQTFATSTEVAALLHSFSNQAILENKNDTYRLTQQGLELYNRCLQQQTTFRQQAVKGISPDDYAITLRTLGMMIRNLDF